MNYSQSQIAAALDLAVLKPTASAADIRNACELANQHGIKSVCVASCRVYEAARLFKNVSTVIGFPHGNATKKAKLQEAWEAMDDGAKELDVVINVGRFLEGDYGIVEDELRDITVEAHARDVLVKAILEACYYSPWQLSKVCALCVRCRVDFVKTSTGFGMHGATPGVIKYLRAALFGTGVFIKASGGIKTYEDARTYLDLGCTRIGASNFSELLP